MIRAACHLAHGLVPVSALALILFTVASCGGETVRAKAGPHVVLIVVDTLRADRLESYGHGRETSPALRDFVAVATRFESAFAPSPWTTPSTATIFSGLHPLRHGSTHQGSALGDDVASLAELVSDAGWQTAGFSFNHNVSTVSRFDQGFDRFDDFAGRSTAYPDIGEMVDTIGQWMDEELRERFFLYLQPMNAHGPYLVPEEHRSDLLGREARGGFQYYGTVMRRIMKKGRVDQRERVSPGMLASLSEHYDVAVRHTMDRLGELLDDLRERGLYDDSLIILTADHGEELFEHGGFSHGYSLHREVLQVPLLMKLPGQTEAAVVDTQVSLADIYPTVAEVLGVPMPYEVDGRSLLTTIREAAGDPELLAARGQLYHVDWERRCVARSYQLGRYKLIAVQRDYTGSREEVRLYDTVADPHELDDLSAREPDRVAELLERMESESLDYFRRRVATPAVVLDDMDQDTLRQLGYL
jgi:arylsulfatase A-like enzyme